ncbi:MAG: GNAT family N-acetyltransferase [Sphingobacteriales bacterium]|jgi:dTDP-4-amino-4,6-dideoxy-D-galactose acyltransferase|nr:GNAT family N-acetyltransferase [Sphingobacteriales bacterium]
MLIEKLAWDSSFFNINIGKVNPGCFNSETFFKEISNFDLIYIFEFPESVLIPDIEKYCNAPVDVKVNYAKSISHADIIDEHITEYSCDEANDELISLGIQSGLHSRFKTDPHFPSGAYEKLYTEWVIRSADKTLADCTLTYKTELDKIAGFITVALRGEAAHIGLIAVDESSRGKGIGKKLLQAAEYHACKHNFRQLRVSTQKANATASYLYEHFGFVAVEEINVYHYWNHPSH